jgi:hypothetical protein
MMGPSCSSFGIDCGCSIIIKNLRLKLEIWWVGGLVDLTYLERLESFDEVRVYEGLQTFVPIQCNRHKESINGFIKKIKISGCETRIDKHSLQKLTIFITVFGIPVPF